MKILVVAGEASADIHAGLVLEKLSRHCPVQLFGIGGDHLQKLGLEPIATASEMAVVGFTEALSRIPQSLRLLRELEIIAEKEKPQLALLVDLPDFNLRLAPRLKALGIPVVYYVSPQVWAWRSKRVHQMSQCLDHLLCILPFEKDWYAKNAPANLRVDYVGHPALEEISDLPYSPDPHCIALLPGSRVREVKSLFPAMIQAAALLRKKMPDLYFELPLAPTLRNNPEIENLLSESGPCRSTIREVGENFKIIQEPSADILRHAKFAIVASGTATLETAIVGTPMLVVYRVSAITAFLFRRLVTYRGPIAMANILHCGLGSENRAIPELLQSDVQPERIAAEVEKYLQSTELWEKQAKILGQTRGLLASSKPGTHSENVVQYLLEYA